MSIICDGWDNVMKEEFDKEYFAELNRRVDEEYATKVVYPPRTHIYSAFRHVAYDDVKVVILGQDPYHGAGQANGMAFAVGKGIETPPSLVNIFKEIESDTGMRPNGSTLVGWAKQGVLLLNTVLTVRAATPQSHSAFGWQQFTDAVIAQLAARKKPMVFMLWGANAHNKAKLIPAHHLVLKSPHPSPLSSYRGFFGCKHFSQANEFLKANGMGSINWAQADEMSGEADYYAGAEKIHRTQIKTNKCEKSE